MIAAVREAVPLSGPGLCSGSMPARPSDAAATMAGLLQLALHSEIHRGWSLADFERLFGPPLRLGQCLLHRRAGAVVGFMSWANLTDEAATGFATRTRRLQPDDWNAGDFSNVWCVDLLAPYGDARQVVRLSQALLRRLARQYGWPATEVHWSRTRGTGRVVHLGRAK